MREVDAGAGVKGIVNRLYERLAMGVGFTRSASSNLSFGGARGWFSLLERSGFSVRAEPSGAPFLADVLFVATRSL
jgi:hypothetical protein